MKDRPGTIHLRPSLHSPRAVFFHELGHVFDLTLLDHADRRRFARIHRRSGRWFGGPNSPGEWFADSYSLCARYGPRLQAHAATSYAYRPSAGRHRASCRLIRAVAKRSRREAPDTEKAPDFIK
jgi:hypothetical protein